jgi:hypothetical protein
MVSGITGRIEYQEVRMEGNKYQVAGWLAIAMAVLYPSAYILKIFQAAVGASIFHYRGPILGPADMLLIIFTCFFVYTFAMFRRLLNERYDIHSIDFLIIVAILLVIISLLFFVFIHVVILIFGVFSEAAFRFAYMAYMVMLVIATGVVDILIAVKLLTVKDKLNDFIKAFAYVTLATGVLEVSIIMAPIGAFVLMPVWCVMLGMIFLREKEEAQFV